jgi:hypothetical protein
MPNTGILYGKIKIEKEREVPKDETLSKRRK